jgi:hypothetical protein
VIGIRIVFESVYAGCVLECARCVCVCVYVCICDGDMVWFCCGDFFVVVSTLSAAAAAAIVGFVSLIDFLHSVACCDVCLGDALIDRVDLVFDVCYCCTFAGRLNQVRRCRRRYVVVGVQSGWVFCCN